MKLVSRRNTLFGLMGLAVIGTLTHYSRRDKTEDLFRFTARALGMDIDMQIAARAHAQAETLFTAAMTVIADMDAAFSLYNPGSEISRLNREGRLDNPSPEFVDLIRKSLDMYKRTDGAFDITVQPLWTLYQDTATPSSEALTQVLTRVGSDGLRVDDRYIEFAMPGMGLTLNGCAQGYITDKVRAFLVGQGVENALINIGEYGAIGPRVDGTPWRVGIQDPDTVTEIIDVVSLNGQALATSAGYGGLFDDDGTATHIFDPRTGVSPSRYASISVIAEDGFTADALATAFLNMTVSDIRRAVAALPAPVQVIIIDLENAIIRL